MPDDFDELLAEDDTEDETDLFVSDNNSSDTISQTDGGDADEHDKYDAEFDDIDTTDRDQDAAPFTPPDKRSFAEAVNPKKRHGAPGKLNNTLILSVIAGVFVTFIITALVLPPLFGKKEKKKEETAGTAATDPRLTDYSLLVPPKEKEEPALDAEPFAEMPPLELPPDAVIAEPVPPHAPAAPPPQQPQTVYTQSSGRSYANERPVTRNDRLQAKSISGIKGVTPTQQRYADGSYQAAQPAQAAQTAETASPYAQYGLPPKDEYLRQALAMSGQGAAASAAPYAGAAPYGTAGGYGGGSNYAAQNDQTGKNAFFENGRGQGGQGQYLPQASVWQGTIFEATLTGDINTDLPGEVTAVIAKNVYSSLDGRWMLIPQGSRLFGMYNSSISYSQSRVQVGWHTLIRPDGYSVNLGNMQATDAKGAAGLKGAINDHPFAYLKALLLISAFRIVGTDLQSAASSGDNPYIQNLVADTQSVVNQFGSKIIDRALDVQPTIVIKAGTKINIVANQSLMLPPLDPYPVTQSYHR
jgi:type IV secretion system protein VirB10